STADAQFADERRRVLDATRPRPCADRPHARCPTVMGTSARLRDTRADYSRTASITGIGARGVQPGGETTARRMDDDGGRARRHGPPDGTRHHPSESGVY